MKYIYHFIYENKGKIREISISRETYLEAYSFLKKYITKRYGKFSSDDVSLDWIEN